MECPLGSVRICRQLNELAVNLDEINLFERQRSPEAKNEFWIWSSEELFAGIYGHVGGPLVLDHQVVQGRRR